MSQSQGTTETVSKYTAIVASAVAIVAVGATAKALMSSNDEIKREHKDLTSHVSNFGQAVEALVNENIKLTAEVASLKARMDENERIIQVDRQVIARILKRLKVANMEVDLSLTRETEKVPERTDTKST